MIFYKRKSIFKKFLNHIKQSEKKVINLSFLKFFKFMFVFCFLFFVFAYFSYLVLLPKYIDEQKIENIVNSYLAKNTKILFEVENLKISPNYKFDIVLSADKINFKYNKNQNFVVLKQPSIDISILSLLFGYLDLNKINSQEITLNTNFTKNNRYSCFDYIDVIKIIENKKTSKIKLRNLHLFANKSTINLYDENLSKNFQLKTNKLKLNLGGENKPYVIMTNGTLSSFNHKITDFNLNLEITPKRVSSNNFWVKLSKVNYNPLIYADIFKFYSKSDIDLKVYPVAKKQNFYGKIFLQNYSFNVGDIRLPDNNLELKFKGDKIVSNCDFKLIKNQFIKINSKINLSKNKFIEAQIKSNEINLADFRLVLNSLFKICNSKLNIQDVLLYGKMNADMYLKSNFKTIISNGNLNINNAKLTHNKIGLVIDKINLDINFENNKINIVDSFGYINDSKFNILGSINKDANLDLKINSELINLSKIVDFIKTLPMASRIVPFLNECDFNSGLVKIIAQIEGTIKNPIIKTNSKIQNINLYLRQSKASFKSEEIHIASNPKKYKVDDISVLLINPIIKKQKDVLTSPKLIFYIKENDILIDKCLVVLNDFRFVLNGIIKNYLSKNFVADLNLSAKAKQKFNNFEILNDEANIKAHLFVKQNKILVSEFNLFEKDLKIASLSGELHNIFSENIIFSNFKVLLIQPLKLVFNYSDKIIFDVLGEISLNGLIKKPNINANLSLPNLKAIKNGIDIKNLILNIKNNKAYINILNGKYFDNYFDLIAQGGCVNNKIIVDNLKISAPYFNANNLKKNKFDNSKSNVEIEINEINGEIKTLDFGEILLNNFDFKGNLKNKILNLATFSSEIFDGKLSGTIKTDLKTKNVKAGIIAKELEVSKISNKINHLAIAASGKLNVLIDVEFFGYEYNEILKSLDGYIRFDIKDGELSQFAKLERFLQAGNILSQSILKLNLNSTLSALTKQNTGAFKIIEGILRIKDSEVKIQSIRSIGSNMSLYLTGNYDIVQKYCDIKVLGRIPTSIVSVMGVFGNFSTSKLVDKLNPEFKEAINSVAVHPFEKMFSVNIPKEDLDKIPQLYQISPDVSTREFIVFVEGLVDKIESIKYFKWNAQ